MKAKWRDGSYRKRLSNGSHTEDRRRKIAAAIKLKWEDPVYRNRTVHGIRKVCEGSLWILGVGGGFVQE